MIEPVVIGAARLYLGDCSEILPSLGEMQGCFDPPYDFDASGGGQFRADRPCMDAIEAEGLDRGFDYGLVKPDQFPGVVIFCHNDQLPELLADLKAKYHRVVVCAWHKTNPLPVANKAYVPDTEFWVHAWMPGHHPVGTLNQLRRYFTSLSGRQDVYDHPTVKPIDLMRKIMRNLSGDVICDPFMGTATTGAAALIHGKAFVGIEKSEKFFTMAVDRIRRVYANGLAKYPTEGASA